MLLPVRLVIEPDAPRFRASEQLFQDLGSASIDRCGRNQRRLLLFPLTLTGDPVSSAPGDQPCDVVVPDISQQFCRSKIINQPCDISPSSVGADVVLTDLIPISACNIIQLCRCGRGCCLYNFFRSVAFGALEEFSLAPVRASRRAVKATTLELEVEVVERT